MQILKVNQNPNRKFEILLNFYVPMKGVEPQPEIEPKFWYNKDMYNWNIKTDKLKNNPEKYIIWKLEQMINFGLNGQKLKAQEVKKYWTKLSLDPQRRKLLGMWLGLH